MIKLNEDYTVHYDEEARTLVLESELNAIELPVKDEAVIRKLIQGESSEVSSMDLLKALV